MAGFFGLFDYSKEGPGVKKNAPQKNRFIIFFEILFAKFWKLILVNLIYVLGLLPLLVLSGLLFWVMPKSDQSLTLVLLFSFSPMALSGPVTAGITRLTRDFVRSEPVFLWADFVGTVKKNWKPSLVISTVTYLFTVLMFVAVPFYLSSTQAEGGAGLLFYIPFAFCMFAVIIFTFMQYYLYLMQVTLDLRLKQMFKNAAILAIAALFKNFLTTLVIALVTAGVVVLGFFSLSIAFLMPIFIAVVAMLYFALIFYVISFNSFPVIKKFIIDPYYEAHPEQTTAALQKADEEEEQKELPEYVYENGRLVHRSVLEKQSLFDDTPLLANLSEDDEEE